MRMALARVSFAAVSPSTVSASDMTCSGCSAAVSIAFASGTVFTPRALSRVQTAEKKSLRENRSRKRLTAAVERDDAISSVRFISFSSASAGTTSS